jgi:hypothetical protein
MQKPDSDQQVKVQEFTDIKPDESYIKTNRKNVLFTSLEQWAMLIFKPPLQTQLEQAKDADAETKERWNRCNIKIQDGYEFHFNKNDYTKENKEKNRQIGREIKQIRYVSDINWYCMKGRPSLDTFSSSCSMTWHQGELRLLLTSINMSVYHNCSSSS